MMKDKCPRPKFPCRSHVFYDLGGPSFEVTVRNIRLNDHKTGLHGRWLYDVETEKEIYWNVVEEDLSANDKGDAE